MNRRRRRRDSTLPRRGRPLTTRPFPATFLGSSEVTLAELALAYTIFPNGGWRPAAPYILDRIEEKDGNVVWQAEHGQSHRTVIKPETAYEVHSCLVDALETGTGTAARTRIRPEENFRPRAKPEPPTISPTRFSPVTTARSLARFGLGSTSRRRFIAAPSAGNRAAGLGRYHERIGDKIFTARDCPTAWTANGRDLFALRIARDG